MSNDNREWYFVNAEGNQLGPTTKEELLALFSRKEIKFDTLVWSSGMTDWTQFENAFKGIVPPPVPNKNSPPAIPKDVIEPIRKENVEKSSEFLGGSYHPWRRYFAKTIDIVILGLGSIFILVIINGIIFPDSEWLNKALSNQIINGIILVFIWAPLDAILLSGIGNTPGRWVFGISVRKASGEKLVFSEAIERAAKVALLGMGLGIPIVAFFTQYSSYKQLTKNGVNTWDSDIGSVVRHTEWGVLRYIVCIAATFFVFCVIGVLNAIGKSS